MKKILFILFTFISLAIHAQSHTWILADSTNASSKAFWYSKDGAPGTFVYGKNVLSVSNPNGCAVVGLVGGATITIDWVHDNITPVFSSSGAMVSWLTTIIARSGTAPSSIRKTTSDSGFTATQADLLALLQYFRAGGALGTWSMSNAGNQTAAISGNRDSTHRANQYLQTFLSYITSTNGLPVSTSSYTEIDSFTATNLSGVSAWVTLAKPCKSFTVTTKSTNGGGAAVWTIQAEGSNNKDAFYNLKDGTGTLTNLTATAATSSYSSSIVPTKYIRISAGAITGGNATVTVVIYCSN